MKAASQYAAEQFKSLNINTQPLTAIAKLTNMELFNLLTNAYRRGFKAGEKGEVEG